MAAVVVAPSRSTTGSWYEWTSSDPPRVVNGRCRRRSRRLRGCADDVIIDDIVDVIDNDREGGKDEIFDFVEYDVIFNEFDDIIIDRRRRRGCSRCDASTADIAEA
jgi:hypothetical protein